MAKKKQAEKLIRDIKRQIRRKFNSEEKIRIVLEGLRKEETVVALCRKEESSKISKTVSWLLTNQVHFS